MAGSSAPSFFSDAVVILGVAVVAAPLFKRAGLGTVLGYLASGIVIGPIFGVIADADQILKISELGVVFLLFVIGLELKPQRLWSLRRDIFGLGASQVLVTGVVLHFLLATFTEFSTSATLVIGFGLALSSTAFAIQVLQDRSELNTPHGQKSFSILLFQDLAIVPLLAIIPLLAPRAEDSAASPIQSVLIAVGAIAAVIIAGRYLLDPLFRIVGNTGAREAMIATALLVVLASAYLMTLAGLSMALGAFLAGVMLAESTYRHQLEADIEPFRGLLLGLFFVAIGMSLEMSVLLDNWLIVLACVPALMIVKSAVLYLLTRLFGNTREVCVRTSLALPQSGEFGFVMFSLAASLGIFGNDISSILIVIVTLSMALTPVAMLLARFAPKSDQQDEMHEEFEDAGSDVLLIGFSRFGQIASQVLLAGGSEVTIIDHSTERVRAAGRFGFRIYYGDGTTLNVLEAAGLREAKIVAICTNKLEVTNKIVELISSTYPDVKLYVRTYDRAHSIDLRRRGIEYEIRETLGSALSFGTDVLRGIGIPDSLAQEIREDVQKRDDDRLRIQIAEGSIHAGQDMLHTEPVKQPVPEPLVKPLHDATIINSDEEMSDAETETKA